jgi:hypothetical protein
MLAFELQDAVASLLVASASAANTAGATSSTGQWMDTVGLEGDIAVIMAALSLTGTITGKLQSASDANGTGATDIAGTGFTLCTSGDGLTTRVQTVCVNAKAVIQRYLGFAGVVVTGPVINLTVVAIARKKYV